MNLRASICYMVLICYAKLAFVTVFHSGVPLAEGLSFVRERFINGLLLYAVKYRSGDYS
ncbi:hypothetical protein SCFA_660074 [anaerobic digester metagenome]|jgi:hypothetical protein|uniref:Uncharacterized protein n=1 Tax=anaerobic digester metagenome TaxID=1263854 RepID=A0A485M3R3_9ZZZZ